MPKHALIVAPADDLHARAVAARIRQLGAGHITPILLDSATLPLGSSLSFSADSEIALRLSVCPPLPKIFGPQAIQALQTADGSARHTLNLSDVVSVWWRRPRRPVLSEKLNVVEFREFAYHNTFAALKAAVEILADRVTVVNRPSADMRASHKLFQLTKALEAKLKVPQTLISHDPSEISAFYEDLRASGREMIYKALHASHDLGQSTQRYDESSTQFLDSAQHCPTIFQEFVPGVNLRIIFVGSKAFAVLEEPSTEEGKLDIRLDLSPKRSSFVLPESELSKIRAFMQATGLVFGALDFKLTPSGEFCFLEINPQGQWLWVELTGKVPISHVLACLLMNKRFDDTQDAALCYTQDELEQLSLEPTRDAYIRAVSDGGTA